jgi:hypothetical protein
MSYIIIYNIFLIHINIEDILSGIVRNVYNSFNFLDIDT